MKVFLEESREELKRVDHLIYVSLKYTRTADVLRSVIQRFISCIESVIDGLLDYAVENKLLGEKPENLGLKCNAAKQVYGGQVNEMVDFFVFLRKVIRAEYKSGSEYRRPVFFTAATDIGQFTFDIDKSKELYFRVKQYVDDAEKLINGEEGE